MGELKPLGSEKLSGDDKLKRILELTYYQTEVNTGIPAETIKESKNGAVYGIVKEKDGYYVKKGLNEQSLDYIGGLFMKNKNKFSSYAQAYKKLEFLIEQEKLEEATKYVLKRPKPVPQEEAPAPMPTGETPPPMATPDDTTMPPAGEEVPGMPKDDVDNDMSPSPEAEEEYLKIIQKLTGKLGERLRDYEDKIKSEDIKYVINMILSAVDLKKLEEADKEEILDKIDPDDEVNNDSLPGDELPGEVAPPEDDLGESDGMAALEELISSNPFDDYYDTDTTTYFDDEDDDFGELDFLDKKAEAYAKRDFDAEDFNDEDESFDEFNDEEYGLTSNTENPNAEEFDDQEDISEYMETMPDEENEIREIDLDELNNMIATGVKETLGKYFE